MTKEIQHKHIETEKRAKSKGVNNLLWVIALLLVAVAAVGNTYFAAQFPLIARIIGLVVLCATAVVVAALTNQGQSAIAFLKDARLELRKIVWPKRQETTQTTLIVGAVCVIVALALWGIDSIIVLIINFLTSLRF